MSQELMNDGHALKQGYGQGQTTSVSSIFSSPPTQSVSPSPSVSVPSYAFLDDVPPPIYVLLDQYFESPRLQKTRDQDAVSIYMVRIQSLLASPEQRYVVVSVPRDPNPIGSIVPLSDLKWMSLQTRMLTNVDPSLHRHSYMPKYTKKYTKRLPLNERYPNRSEYEFDKECVMALMHTNPNQKMEFPEQVVLSGSIELYRTVFVRKIASK